MARKKAEAKIVKLVLIKEGTFHIPVTKSGMFGDMNYVPIRYPLMIRGAGQEKTIIHGGFNIQGTKEEGNNVVLKDMTMRSIGSGLLNENGLSFLCDRMTFTQCRGSGVRAYNTKGRLINCVITQCGQCGIWCDENSLLELEGDQTKVDGNGTLPPSGHSGWYGLKNL